MTSKTRVVIVGGGMAGARLAQQLGTAPGVAVTVLAAEPHPAYNRVLLAEVLAGRYPAEVITLPGPAAGVTWRSGTRVARIDRAGRRVVCDDGTEVPYDRLVLATGANPVLPPLVRGGGLPDGVHPFRTLDDCHALQAAVAPRPDGTAPHAVVIGGGLLGVLAARALVRRGARVVLAQQGERLMERQLDGAASGLLRTHLTELGVEVHTECRVRRLRTAPAAAGGGGPRVRAVELADGFELAADLVVLTCGVRPGTALARAAGLAIGPGGGIVVDDRLTTSDPAVHAIGDCAEHDGTVYGLAAAAQDQADVLARVVAGEDGAAARYTGTRALVRLTLSDDPAAALDLAVFGRTTPGAGDDVVQLADATRRAYRKIVVRGDRLAGGVLMGDLASVGTLARTWESDEPLPATTPLLHLLTHDGGF